MFDFGKANPNPERTGTDTVNTGGTLMGDILGPVSTLFGMGKVGSGAGAAGYGGAALGNFMLGASEIAAGQYAGGLGDMGASVMNTVGMLNPELAASTPGLGVAAGGMQMIGHGIEAAKHVDEIDKGYQNNQFWTETGNATLGGANALAALDPTGISSLYVGGTQLALDGVGALSGAIFGEDYRFSAGSAIGAAEHAVFDTGQAIGQGAMAVGGALSDGYDAVMSW
jgi:hypothetical protein